MRKTSTWIIEEYLAGNMKDFDGNAIKPNRLNKFNVLGSLRSYIIGLYENGEIYHISEEVRSRGNKYEV